MLSYFKQLYSGLHLQKIFIKNPFHLGGFWISGFTIILTRIFNSVIFITLIIKALFLTIFMMDPIIKFILIYLSSINLFYTLRRHLHPPIQTIPHHLKVFNFSHYLGFKYPHCHYIHEHYLICPKVINSIVFQ